MPVTGFALVDLWWRATRDLPPSRSLLAPLLLTLLPELLNALLPSAMLPVLSAPPLRMLLLSTRLVKPPLAKPPLLPSPLLPSPLLPSPLISRALRPIIAPSDAPKDPLRLLVSRPLASRCPGGEKLSPAVGTGKDASEGDDMRPSLPLLEPLPLRMESEPSSRIWLISL